jgi:hypothetical protein
MRLNAGVAALALAWHCQITSAAAPLTYIGQQILPTGAAAFATQVGGLSGIEYNAATGRYFAISDDRANSALQPGITDNRARFYDIGLDLSKFTRSNTPGFAGVTVNAVTFIKKPDGTDFGPATLDPESIRFDGANLYWTSEGARSGSDLQNPFVRKMTPAGTHLTELATPSRYHPAGSGATDPGVRNNLAFESLTLSHDGTKLYTATENALVQDGPAASLANASPARVIEFDKTTGNPLAEFAYMVAPVVAPPVPSNGFATNGLVEMLAIGERQFITVERSFSIGAGNAIKLYYADARNATDVSSIDSLASAAYTPMTKQLLLDLAELRNDDNSPVILDNIEGITFGPMFDGKPTIILVSDNNFSPTQFTQFIALSQVGPVPEPEAYALMLAGLALVGAAVKRRRLALVGRKSDKPLVTTTSDQEGA